MNPILGVLTAHRSIRQFKPDPIPAADLHAAIAAGQMASTSGAVQAYCVLRVTDPDKRARLAQLTGPQEKVRLAPEFLVICGDTRRHRLAAQRDGHPYQGGFEAFLVAVIDAALFAEKAAIAFEAMGYGICYIGGLRNDLAAVDELLGVPHGVFPLFGLCAGKPDQDPSQRPRLPIEAVLYEDTFPPDAEVLTDLTGYDAAYAHYMSQRGAEAKGWSQGLASKYAKPSRPELAPYYRKKGADLA